MEPSCRPEVMIQSFTAPSEDQPKVDYYPPSPGLILTSLGKESN